MTRQDYYEVSDVSKAAKECKIRRVYKHLAMKYHPDRNQGDKEAEAELREIKEAYEVLIGPQKCATYDQYSYTMFE